MLKQIFVLLILMGMISLIPAYELTINSEISGDDFIGTGMFIAGVHESANDGMDFLDGRMIENPSYGIPLYSAVSGENFMIDYKSDLIVNQSKVWSITQRGSRDFRSLNELTEKINWDFSSVPSNVRIVLIDYGLDSTRDTIIKEINLREISSYEFQINRPYGEYRYFDLVMTSPETNNPEVSENTPSSSGSGSGTIRQNNNPDGLASASSSPDEQIKNPIKLANNFKNTSTNNFFSMTGAAIGALGAVGTTILVIFILLLVIALIFIFIKRKKE